jgi:hypothetical protein
MKVFINGFWENFVIKTEINFRIFKKLLELTFNEEIFLGNFYDSDILLESVFSKTTYLFEKKWKYSFFFNGESVEWLIKTNYDRFGYIPNYDCILSGRFTNFEKKTVNFPLFLAYIESNKLINHLHKVNNITNVPKKLICAVISNGEAMHRNYILNKLEENFNIDYAGKYRNNIDIVAGGFLSNDLINLYSQYKFVICIENAKQETYITEKIVNGFLSGSIPIYWGSPAVTEYFNENRFINICNLQNDTIELVISKIKMLIENDDEYLKIVNEPIFKNNFLSINVENRANDIKKLLNL